MNFAHVLHFSTPVHSSNLAFFIVRHVPAYLPTSLYLRANLMLIFVETFSSSYGVVAYGLAAIDSNMHEDKMY